MPIGIRARLHRSPTADAEARAALAVAYGDTKPIPLTAGANVRFSHDANDGIDPDLTCLPPWVVLKALQNQIVGSTVVAKRAVVCLARHGRKGQINLHTSRKRS